jgi:hypothetical protein
MATSESDEWTNDGHGALHPLSAAEYYARRLNRTYLYHCTKVRIFNTKSTGLRRLRLRQFFNRAEMRSEQSAPQ